MSKLKKKKWTNSQSHCRQSHLIEWVKVADAQGPVLLEPLHWNTHHLN